MPVTIYDVAKKANVGIGTVSRVINNSPQIRPETKSRVLRAIEELNYQPHTVAQSLARKRTKTLACIMPVFTGYFYVELLRGIQRRASAMSNDLILYSVDSQRDKEIFLRRVLRERKVDGVFLVSLEITDEFSREFIAKKIPIVLVDGFHAQLDSIKVENAEGAYTATRHLIDLGYERIAMIDGQLKSLPARQRFEGYKKALEDHRIPFQESYFVACDFVEEADGFNKEAGYAAMNQLLDLDMQRPRAVFVSSDIQALGAIDAIRERGLSVPRDIAVVGFDDIELARHVGLTTMRQPIREMGELAVERLLRKIDGEKDADFKRRFHTELIVRDTCGAKLKMTHDTL